jgi:hypothetical protein
MITCLVAVDDGYKVSADLDGVTKCNEFMKTAAATKHIPPNLACNFDGPEKEVEGLAAKQELNLKSFVDSDGVTNASFDGA